MISLVNRGDGQYHLGCLCIRNIRGRESVPAFRHMLSVFLTGKRITLETPADKRGEHRILYEKNVDFILE